MAHKCKLPEILVGFLIYGWQDEETIYVCECEKVYVINSKIPQFMFYKRAWVFAIDAKPHVTVYSEAEDDYQSARSEDEISTANSDGVHVITSVGAGLSSASASTDSQASKDKPPFIYTVRPESLREDGYFFAGLRFTSGVPMSKQHLGEGIALESKGEEPDQ